MGLLTIIRKNREKEREMRILFLGLDNAGKTTILKNLSGEDVKNVNPTLGFNIKTFMHGKYTLNIWDVGGQKTLRPYWRNYFEQTDAVVWVVDSCDHLRIQDCKQELHALLTEDRLAGASLLVFANKQDIQGSMNDLQISEVTEINGPFEYAMTVEIIGARSAVHPHGLEWIVTDVATRLYYNTTMTQDHLKHATAPTLTLS